MQHEFCDIFRAVGGFCNTTRDRFLNQILDGVNPPQFTVNLLSVPGLPTPPLMHFRINDSIATTIIYDNSRIRPILSNVFPKSSGIKGAIEVTINGIDLDWDLEVYFCIKVATIVEGISNIIWVVVVAAGAGEEADLYMENSIEEQSNMLKS